MMRTVEAVVDENGCVRLMEKVKLTTAHRALVTILDDRARLNASETALLSERALSEGWDRPEEDEAWAYLQPER